MTDSLLQHLTPDEVELWAQGLLPAARDTHLAQCAECRTIAERERRLIRELSQLTRFTPEFGFVERVMAKVKTPTPSSLAALPSRTAISTVPPLPTKATSAPRPTSPNVRASVPISVPATLIRTPGSTWSPGMFEINVPNRST